MRPLWQCDLIWVALGCLAASAAACEQGVRPSTEMSVDAGSRDALPDDIGLTDAATGDASSGPSQQGPCAVHDVLCPTRGFAHFTISNVQGSGLPNQAQYQVTDALIEDRVTGLIWQRHPPGEYFGWQQARDYCASLEQGARSDFRLPGRIELVTLLDFDQLPVIASVFDDVVADYHWTSSRASFVSGSAYSVYFGAGETTIADASPGRALVRCVAGKVETLGADQFEVDGERVLDHETKLVWQRKPESSTTFEQALARCEDSNMRLPSIRELQSIVDESRHRPALDTDFFQDAEPRSYWSATLRGSDPWTVDFDDGKTYADRRRDEQLSSRCVTEVQQL